MASAFSDVLSTRAIQHHHKVAWSSQGLIAYAIDSDDSPSVSGNLFFTWMECPDGKHWHLALPTSYRLNNTIEKAQNARALYKPGREIPNLKYLQFSNTGWDLFCADQNGHISILVTGIKRVDVDYTQLSPPPLTPVEFTRSSINNCVLFYSDPPKADNENNQVVTMKWLNIEKSCIINSPAIKVQQTKQKMVLSGAAAKLGAASDDSSGFYFQYNTQTTKPFGVTHPVGSKQACIALRKNGELCLIYQEEHGIEFRSVTTKLDIGPYAINDASIGFTRDGKIIIAAYIEREQNIRFFEAEIDWSFIKVAAKIIQEQPGYKAPEDQRIPPKINISNLFEKSVGSNLQGLVFEKVLIISPTFATTSKMDILMQYSADKKFTNSDSKTVLIRYSLDSIRTSQSISKSFKNMASKKGLDTTIVSGISYTLNKVQQLLFNDKILSIDSFSGDTQLCFLMGDGSIKPIDRTDFKFINNPYSKSLSQANDENLIPNSIQSLFDAGFEFPRIGKQFQYCTISSNMCAYVYLPIDSKRLELSCLTTDNIHESYYNKKKGLMMTTAVAVAFKHTNACYNAHFTEDLIATVRNEMSFLPQKANDSYCYRVMVSIIQECHRALNLNIDITNEQSESMTRNQPLQRLLSLQLALGTSENWSRTKSGKIALALINLRYIITSEVYVINTVYQNVNRFSKKGIPDFGANLKARQECVLSVLGLVRWSLDYMAMIGQELLAFVEAYRKNDSETITKLLKESIAIPLIVGKIPRAFLLTAIMTNKRMLSFIQKLLEKSDPSLMSIAMKENSSAPFKVIKDIFYENDSSALFKSAGTKTARALLSLPTLEAYYSLSSMVDSLPISFSAFEKFIGETDAPLRNMKLDQLTSLAMEQQIVCQGFIVKNFITTVKDICTIFEKTVLSSKESNETELGKFKTPLLGLSNSTMTNLPYDQRKHGVIIPLTDTENALKQLNQQIRRQLYGDLLFDTLRKQLKKPEEKLRKCIRCGSISFKDDELILVTSVFSYIHSPVFQHYQRQCICGGNWADI